MKIEINELVRSRDHIWIDFTQSCWIDVSVDIDAQTDMDMTGDLCKYRYWGYRLINRQINRPR